MRHVEHDRKNRGQDVLVEAVSTRQDEILLMSLYKKMDKSFSVKHKFYAVLSLTLFEGSLHCIAV